MTTDITVSITSFGRAKYLSRALQSVVDAGIDSIVVSAMEPDKEVMDVLALFPQVLVSIIDHDLGCHENWLQAAYHCPTKRMILLHDDDLLAKDLGRVYQETIKPAMDSGRVQWCSWRAHLMADDGTVRPTEWIRKDTGQYPSSFVRDFLLKRGRLSLSPVVSIFDRDTLIKSLKEGGDYLHRHEECLYRPGMLLGTEIIVYLRHAADLNRWMFVDQVLSYYGACDSSGTVAAQKAGDLRPLTIGYDRARAYFSEGHYTNPVQEPRIIFVYDEFPAHSEDEFRRFEYAYWTWQFHFNQGQILEFPTNVMAMSRSSADIGDLRPVPYFRDLIEYGIRFARPEDVVVYCNRDAFLTTMAPERILSAVKKHGIAIAWRRSFTPKSDRMYKDVTHAKKDGGADLICVTPRWWAEHGSKYPEMFIGRETFDWVLRILAEELHGKDIYMDNVIGHEPHSSFWAQHKKTNPAQIHNRNIARVFFARKKDRRALHSLQ